LSRFLPFAGAIADIHIKKIEKTEKGNISVSLLSLLPGSSRWLSRAATYLILIQLFLKQLLSY
jgi:hypothetical protein